MSFHLHEQLLKDTVEISDLPLCKVLLMNNRHFPWLILVPRIADIIEIHDLSLQDQQQLFSEITSTSSQMKQLFSADKMNIAALGNVVPQLHIHVIARFQNDLAWPKPVWGQACEPYASDELEKQVERLNLKLFKR